MGSSVVTPLIVSLLGSGGGLGIIVALVKLRGDRDSAAISQAHGANEALVASLTAVERERDYWKQRSVDLEAAYDQLLNRVSHRT